MLRSRAIFVSRKIEKYLTDTIFETNDHTLTCFNSGWSIWEFKIRNNIECYGISYFFIRE